MVVSLLLVELPVGAVPEERVVSAHTPPIPPQGDCVYIVKTGEVLISKHADDAANRKDRASVLVSRIKVGEYFGERALLTNEPR